MFKWIPASHQMETQGAPREIAEKGTKKEAMQLSEQTKGSHTYSTHRFVGIFANREIDITAVFVDAEMSSCEMAYWVSGERKTIKYYGKRGLWQDIFYKIMSLRGYTFKC